MYVKKDALRDALASVLANVSQSEFETAVTAAFDSLPPIYKRRAAPVGWRYLDETGAAEAFQGAPEDSLYREEAELALIAAPETVAVPGRSESVVSGWRAEAHLGDYGYAVSAGTRNAALTLLLALADALEMASRRDSGDFTAVARQVGFAEICGPSQARPSPLG
jgi:hypothetical protein